MVGDSPSGFPTTSFTSHNALFTRLGLVLNMDTPTNTKRQEPDSTPSPNPTSGKQVNNNPSPLSDPNMQACTQAMFTKFKFKFKFLFHRSKANSKIINTKFIEYKIS